MTSMPASRRARATTLTPRSWPSRPGLATTTRMRPCATVRRLSLEGRAPSTTPRHEGLRAGRAAGAAAAAYPVPDPPEDTTRAAAPARRGRATTGASGPMPNRDQRAAYLPPRAAKARKLILRSQLGLPWLLAATLVASLILLAGVLLLARGGRPGGPWVRVDPLATFPPGALAEVPRRGLGGRVVVVDRRDGDLRAFVGPAAVRADLALQAAQADPLAVEQLDDPLDREPWAGDEGELLAAGGAAAQQVAEGAQAVQGGEDQHHGAGREQVAADPDGHAEGTGRPDAGRGGEPADGEAVAQDGAAAEEADAGDDLGGQPARVGALAEPVRGDEGEQAGADGQQDVRAQAGGLVGQLPLGAHQPAEDGGEGQPGELFEVGGHVRSSEVGPAMLSRLPPSSFLSHF